MATADCKTIHEQPAALTDRNNTAQVFGDFDVFAVREGVLRIDDALNLVSSMLAVANATATMVAVDADNAVMFGVASQIEAAKAVLDSALGSMIRKTPQDTTA